MNLNYESMRNTFTSILILVCLSCKEHTAGTLNTDQNREVIGWHHKDLEIDSLPGIGLSRAYEELIDETNGEEVIVALIDSPIDIDHEDLKDQIYVNSDEIPDNGVDDDSNGYVDDLHGWNFLGYGKDKTIKFANYDYIRVLRRLRSEFKDCQEIPPNSIKKAQFQKYQKALALLEADIPDVEGELAYHKEELSKFNECIKLFPEAYSKETGLFKPEVVDTLTPNTERQKVLFASLDDFAYYGLYLELLEDYVHQGEARKAKCSNLDYNERDLIGDDIYDLSDIRGNPTVSAPDGWLAHGTQVAGVIAATRNNGIGIKGISNNIKLMVLSVFPQRGDELDKDVANAIRYAVDNGAKVINFSHGRHFVDREDILMDALMYANDHDVLVVTAAGNDPDNIDDIEKSPFPRDNPDNGDEIISNLIKVSASGKNPERIKPSWSSYGANNVDFFAPGQRIRTTNSGSKPYFELGGSSVSCAITSGVAALLFSQYPDLTSDQVKTILMLSGTKYDYELKLHKNLHRNFTELSKSGKVLNAYNALLMAREVSKIDS